MNNLSPWKDVMKEKPLVGCFVTFALPDIAEYTAALGFDFLLIDNEHGVMEQSVLADMVRASQCTGHRKDSGSAGKTRRSGNRGSSPADSARYGRSWISEQTESSSRW